MNLWYSEAIPWSLFLVVGEFVYREGFSDGMARNDAASAPCTGRRCPWAPKRYITPVDGPFTVSCPWPVYSNSIVTGGR